MISELLKAQSNNTISNYVFIQVPSKLNDKIGSLHLALDPSLIHRGMYATDETGTKPFNEEHHVRTSGVVIAAPSSLTKRPLREHYLGSPRYAPHLTHDDIKTAASQAPPLIAKNYGRNNYYPGNPRKSYQYQPNNPEIVIGDKIYFEYSTLLSDDAYFDEDENGIIYMVPYQSIYCYVRDGKINMVNGWVFVESVVKEQESKHIIFVNNKPQPNIGRVAHAGKFLDTFVANEGDKCLFLRTLFTVKDWHSVQDNHLISGYQVEGKQYYPMRNWEIVAVEKGGKWETVNDFVQVVPEMINTIKKVDTIVYEPDKFQNFKQGQIFIPKGSNVHEKAKRVRNYGFGTVKGQKVAYARTGFYLFLNDSDSLFIHRRDIFGTFIEDPDPLTTSFKHEEKFPELYLNK